MTSNSKFKKIERMFYEGKKLVEIADAVDLTESHVSCLIRKHITNGRSLDDYRKDIFTANANMLADKFAQGKEYGIDQVIGYIRNTKHDIPLYNELIKVFKKGGNPHGD